ncbi:hypothetical protein L1987_06560 [Smallanthus sonchifolius]|uniref:Uncharacterized protein n=1 Tax=Smallanthus sonchifolius TaxID=185202 RepID=A0ACB9JYJ3_9ASTR|nr:hypothetical protein L1987_06560 [Smallanthus sonchifolius]
MPRQVEIIAGSISFVFCPSIAGPSCLAIISSLILSKTPFPLSSVRRRVRFQLQIGVLNQQEEDQISVLASVLD